MRKQSDASYHKKSVHKDHKKDASPKRGSFGKKTSDNEKASQSADRKKSFNRSEDRPTTQGASERKPFERKPFDRKKSADTRGRKDSDKKPFEKKSFPDTGEKKPFERRTADKRERTGASQESRPERRTRKPSFSKELPEATRTKKSFPDSETKPIEGAMTLNKYIAHSGECSRRDAAEMVKQGKVRVNGELILEPGYRVEPGDQVTLSGKKLTPQKNLVYILLNKPKGYITTTEDPQERKTVMDLVANSGVDRLFPVGRLDRNTTGVLLLTNDGALAHKLSHPSYAMKKVYHVTLDKNLTRADYEKIAKGVELEDGIAQVDEIAYLENRKEVGLEIHSGKNRIVRRIFESLGYTVEKLDRVMYAGLTKKNVTRGKWRFLTEKEIIFLKHFKG